MFTSSNQDILKVANARINAQLKPLTFLGKQDEDMPNEISKYIPLLIAQADKPDFQSWVDAACHYLLKNEISEEMSNKCGDEEKKLFTILVCILQSIIRKQIRRDEIETDLHQLNIPDHVIEIIVQKIASLRTPLESRLETPSVEYPKVIRVHWRVDMIMGSSELQAMTPLIHLILNLSNGSTKSFQLSYSKFQTLRYTVAKLLFQMNDVESHPMLQIINALETEARKNL